MSKKPTSVLSKLQESVKAARRASVPLIAVETADPAATMSAIASAINGGAPIVSWDVCRGFVPVNSEARPVVNQLLGESDPITATNPQEAVSMLGRAPGSSKDGATPGTVIFWHNGHKFIDNERVMQGIWLLRDEYKRSGRMFIMFGPSFQLSGAGQ